MKRTTLKRTPFKREPSDKKRRFDAELRRVSPEVLGRGCEFWRYAGKHTWEIDGSLICRGALLVHHAKGRRVRDANDPANLRCLCERHHVAVHANSAWSRDRGLMLSRVA